MTGTVIDDEPSILIILAMVLKPKSNLRPESIGMKGAESVYSDPFFENVLRSQKRVFSFEREGLA